MSHAALRAHVHEIGGAAASALGVLTANQEQVEWWLRCAGSLIAIIAGGLTIISLLRKAKD